ncbi:MAG TPA: hypothetical protein VNO22_12835 [Planctomycetota bacterium]|jgi:hypothetical protein|nr:hypothetical protein [Planctomycetota bacterium]
MGAVAAALLALAAQAAPPDATLEAIRDALRRTAAAGYSYRVRGRYERAGEYLPDGLLVSRVRQYRSVRLGERILVRGPEGLWKTPGERIGESVERPDPEAEAIVRLLTDARPPHEILACALDAVKGGRPPEEREIEGVACLRTLLPYRETFLKESLSAQIEKAVRAGTLQAPDEIRWNSTLRGTIAFTVRRADGLVLRVRDERSVKVAYARRDGPPEVRTYRLDMEFEFSDWGAARADVPPEVRARLESKD